MRKNSETNVKQTTRRPRESRPQPRVSADPLQKNRSVELLSLILLLPPFLQAILEARANAVVVEVYVAEASPDTRAVNLSHVLPVYADGYVVLVARELEGRSLAASSASAT